MHPAIEPWMQQVGQRDKRNLCRLARIAQPSVVQSIGYPRSDKPGQVPEVSNRMPRSWSASTIVRPSMNELAKAQYKDVPFGGTSEPAEALRHLIKPEFHPAIDSWVRKAEPSAKQAVCKLKKIAEPTLLDAMQRPTPFYKMRSEAEVRPHFEEVKDRLADPLTNLMARSFTDIKMLTAKTPEFSTMYVDRYETQIDPELVNLKKPGGAYLKMTDTTDVMYKKNEWRNRSGTLASLA